MKINIKKICLFGFLCYIVGVIICDYKYNTTIEKQIGKEKVVLMEMNNPLMGISGRNYLQIYKEDGTEVFYSDFNGDLQIDRIGEKGPLGGIRKYFTSNNDFTIYSGAKRAKFEAGQKEYESYLAKLQTITLTQGDQK